MEIDIPTVNFILRESDISASNTVGDYPLSNAKGSIDQFRTSITWNAVCIKNILGTLYDKYELFDLEVMNIQYPIPTTLFGVTDDDRCIHFIMSGLNWVFNSYNTFTFNTTSDAIITNARFTTQTAPFSTDSNYRRLRTTFRKCITTDINIDLYNVNDDPPNMNAGTIFPQLTFFFKITPVVNLKV